MQATLFIYLFIFYFFIKCVINHAYGSSSEANFTAVKAKTHGVHKLGTFFRTS